MLGLTIELTGRCRSLFLRCPEFDDDAYLRSVFGVTELSAFRSGLPEANNIEKRVNLVIDYMIGKYVAGQSNQPLLLVLLKALHSRRFENDALKTELNDLISAIAQPRAGAQWLDLPFVIVTMTSVQASELDLRPFAWLSQMLQSDQNILQVYGDLRESWRPFPGEPLTISELVLETTEAINEARISSQSTTKLLRPKSYSDGFFAADNDHRLRTYEELANNGCVLIVDPLALTHPTVMDVLAQSELVSQGDRVAIVVLFPMLSARNTLFHNLEQMITDRIPRSRSRYRSASDHFYEFGIDDPLAFRRRLYQILPQAADVVANRRPNQATLMEFRDGSGLTSIGINQAFSGGQSSQ